jgi:hypothetical protein
MFLTALAQQHWLNSIGSTALSNLLGLSKVPATFAQQPTEINVRVVDCTQFQNLWPRNKQRQKGCVLSTTFLCMQSKTFLSSRSLHCSSLNCFDICKCMQQTRVTANIAASADAPTPSEHGQSATRL